MAKCRETRSGRLRALLIAVALAFGLGLVVSPASANDAPGKGQTVTPGYEGVLEGLVETYVVIDGLKRLGYEVKPEALVKPAIKYVALAQGDIDFLADGWIPTQESLYDKANRNGNLVLVGPLVSTTSAGYFVDKKTIEKYRLTNIDQFKDPKIAKLFDTDGSGKAALYGCPQGWGCERRIEFQLDSYGLRSTVRQVNGEPALLAADIVRRYKDGDPVLFFTYTPQWLSQVLVPGKDVDYLEVPNTSLPDGNTANTKLPDGRNIGHPVGDIYVVSNKSFLARNPAAKRLFELIKIPVEDVSAENYQIYKGEKSFDDIHRHAEQWILKHQKDFDGWIAEAARAGG
jgi:glycine betaine/proline transport system substrate-binding protein